MIVHLYFLFKIFKLVIFFLIAQNNLLIINQGTDYSDLNTYKIFFLNTEKKIPKMSLGIVEMHFFC